jgi:creatinine amidohydrolase
MAVTDFMVLKAKYENAGDHAGAWETSHLLASHPDTVDLSLAADELQYGIFTTRNPIDSTASFGEEIYSAAAEEIVGRVRAWLENPNQFTGHGLCLD